MEQNNAGFFNGSDKLAQYLVSIGEQLQKNKIKKGDVMVSDDVTYVRNGNDEWVPLKTADKYVEETNIYPDTLRIFSLNGLLKFINAHTFDEGTILQVADENKVFLFTAPSENTGKRHLLATCVFETPHHFFGRYMDSEVFNTWLLSEFVQTEETETVFSLTKSMVKEQSLNTADDGVSQAITVKQGVTCSNVLFKNPVPLTPIRTFPEAIQPRSNFVLRVNKDGEIALYEGDGGAWRQEAVHNVALYLETFLKNDNVLVIA